MGSGLSFNANEDSPSTPGQKSVVSSAVEGVAADKLLEGMEKYIRAGLTANGKEAKFEVTDKDGGILVHQNFVIPEMFGGGVINIYNLYKIDKANSAVHVLHYPSEFSFKRNEVMSTNNMKVLNDPVRVEFWQDAHEGRSSGPMQKAMMEKVLKEFGAQTTVECDQPSVSDAGKFSALTGAISGGSLDPETYFESFKTFLTDIMGATELPDGTIIEERSSVLGDLGVGAKSFAKHVIAADENHLYCHEYGDDESLTELVGITHVQVHKDPFRLEQWNVQQPGRRAGESQLKLVKDFVTGVLKHMEESG